MNTIIKATLINNIINVLNSQIKAKNKELCNHNLHEKQTPLHGSDMFIKFSFMDDKDLLKVSEAVGI